MKFGPAPRAERISSRDVSKGNDVAEKTSGARGSRDLSPDKSLEGKESKAKIVLGRACESFVKSYEELCLERC